MAEIKIEKKKPIWPWILFIIILLAVIAYFVYANNENDDYPDDVGSEETDDINDTTSNDSINYQNSLDFSDTTTVIMTYSESIKDSTRIGTDSTYTKTALYNLSKAVTAKASQYNLESFKALENLKQYTAQIDGMADSRISNAPGISKNLKTVSINIVSVLEKIQAKNFPALNNDVADLKQKVNQLTTTALEKQQTKLQAFFRKANEVLNKMNS